MSHLSESKDPDRAPPNAVLGYFVAAPALPADELLSLGTLWGQLWRKKIPIGILAIGLGAGAFFGSLFLKHIYRAETVLAIVKSDQPASSLANVVGQLGGLAALAGLRASGGSRDEQLAFLRSNGLKRQFIEHFDLLPVLFAEHWDAKNARWASAAPTMQMAVKKFGESVLQIDLDKVTGLIRLSCEWRDREAAARWTNEYVLLANDLLRDKAVREANSSIAYLNTELRKATSVELQQAIYRLIQEQMNSAMMANVRQDYAFSVIDPAMTPDFDRYVRPRPTLYGVIAAFFGVLLGSIVALRGLRKQQTE